MASSDFDKPSDIRISIKEARINQYRYSALSYAWGQGEDAIPSEPIMVESKDSQRIKITPSLHAALSNFQGSHSKVLWIDALCIDQTDAEEKSIQVERMATIYRKASDVVIWLGRSTQASDSAMNFIQDISVRELDRLARDSAKGDLWRALAELMRRPVGILPIILLPYLDNLRYLWYSGHSSISRRLPECSRPATFFAVN